ncbi:MAG: hypothetical protein GY862_17205, partial [Gammaproteobacteria bacterium]|nr:hypothetical protein [Gammaproteobacteria bacterium]
MAFCSGKYMRVIGGSWGIAAELFRLSVFDMTPVGWGKGRSGYYGFSLYNNGDELNNDALGGPVTPVGGAGAFGDAMKFSYGKPVSYPDWLVFARYLYDSN